MQNLQKINRCLISVSDKFGIVELAQYLQTKNIEIISTGGTYKLLKDNGVKVIEISEFTQFPEMMDGRLKTLHPKVHGGLLGILDNENHVKQAQENDILSIDLLVVNLYPFVETVAKTNDEEIIIENIDIGGPAMVRSASKNFAYKTIITDVGQYEGLIAEMNKNSSSTSFEFRKEMAIEAFRNIAEYDLAISNWFVANQPLPESLRSSTLPQGEGDERVNYPTLEGGSKSLISGRGNFVKADKFYSAETLIKAKELQKNQTDAEGFLWYYLQNKQLGGFKFRKQQPIENYIIDFVCLEKKLIIELEGEQHNEETAIKYDNKRTEFLEKLGFRVLRFWNNEIFNNIDNVLDKILFEISNPSPNRQQVYSSTLPQGEGDKTEFILTGTLKQSLRYGENSHQQAAIYQTTESGIVGAKQLQGKELSYNNLNDADAAYNLALEFEKPICAIIKHANPCGVALGKSHLEAFKKAFQADSKSAFGGIVAINGKIDADLATEMAKIFFEVIIAKEVDEKAIEIFAKKKNLRILIADFKKELQQQVKSVSGGFLVQDLDQKNITKNDLKLVSKISVNDEDLEQLVFAMNICKYVKSNAITVVNNFQTVGLGAGQTSRVDACEIACKKASEFFDGENTINKAKGGFLASDAFFPFADNIEIASKFGIKAIVATGGSIRDDEVIVMANEKGIALYFVETRHFRH